MKRNDSKDEELSSVNLAKKYKHRYVHPVTGTILKSSQYIKNGQSVRAPLKFFINNEWVKEEMAPERREWRRKRNSSMKGFLQHIKRKITEKNKTHGKFLIGDNEFQDKYNCYDKLREHLDKHIKQYGFKCPITGLEFTTVRKHQVHYDGIRRKERLIITNLSADRILNHINYTKQNVIFTSTGWNIVRGDLSLSEMKMFLNKNHVKRYEEILKERFPEYEEKR